ncbi:PREDICTED: uncharacterized protein LOC105449097 [Wasmannia auropunctata]|uniref:uncharacterized protein LOC105449097 n=1 Tax=Wasmannia auropunctata TaxID=64793 RepID=UPI0005EF9ACB|nr:PREDICTED: uncharacterized protein LOC105449097 [Wasmannia auropunctata]
MASKYSIIHFLDEETVEIVPVSWIKEKADGKTECYWPPTNFPAKLIMRAACPDEKYSLHACRVMQTYDDYATARMYLPKAEFYSDIEYKSQNESLGKRKRKPNKIQFSSSSEEEEESEEEEGEKEKESQVKKMKVIAKKCTIPESLSRKASNFERSKEIFKNCSAAQKEVVSTLSTSTPPKNIVSKSSDSSLPKTVMSRLSSSSPPQKFVSRSSLISSNEEEMSSNMCLQLSNNLKAPSLVKTPLARNSPAQIKNDLLNMKNNIQ